MVMSTLGLNGLSRTVRFYAKAAKAVKAVKKDTEIASFNLETPSNKMKGFMERYESSLSQIRVGRAHSGLLDRIKLEKDGKTMALVSVAQISVKDPRNLLVILPDESLTPLAESAIRGSNLGFNPLKLEPTVLQVPVPKMNDDMKKSMLKMLVETTESTRSHFKKARIEALETLKKSKVSKDDHFKSEKAIQKIMDDHVKSLNDRRDSKKREIETA